MPENQVQVSRVANNEDAFGQDRVVQDTMVFSLKQPYLFRFHVSCWKVTHQLHLQTLQAAL